LGVVVVMLCCLWGNEIVERRFALIDPLCALATIAIIQAAAQANASDRIRSILERGLLFEVGVFSYSLYLIHAPVLQLAWQYAVTPVWTTDGARFVGLLIIGPSICLITAMAFYSICEKPFLARPTSPAPIGVAPNGAQGEV
jgi:peptidoglycan/LPS O-acetylase OafA/YrhL